MIVMKFGGTSTQDAAAIQNVVRIVSARLDLRPTVVISAIAQATNDLERAGKLAAEGEEPEAHEVGRNLMDRHLAIIDKLVAHPQRREELRSALASSRERLDELVRGIAILRELTPRTLDALYCYGELLSSRIVTGALQESGIDAVWIDAKEFMITDDQFNSAAPIVEEVEQRLASIALPLLQRGSIPVTQGFIGATLSGLRTTMGRESSDYSAAVIGAALHVDDIQIWTDVDGVLTADPRVVPHPMNIARLSFQEAYELSFFGAKVLHPNTMLPAIEENIPVHIYNSRHAERGGTLVADRDGDHEPVIKSVAYKQNLVLLRVIPRRRFNQFVVWEHIFNVLTKYTAPVLTSTTSEYSMSFVVEAKANLEGIVHEIEELGRVHRRERQGILCIVGTNIRECPDLMMRIFTALSRYKINAVSFGASPSGLTVILDDDRVVEAVKQVHAELFGSAREDHMFKLLEERVP